MLSLIFFTTPSLFFNSCFSLRKKICIFIFLSRPSHTNTHTSRFVQQSTHILIELLHPPHLISKEEETHSDKIVMPTNLTKQNRTNNFLTSFFWGDIFWLTCLSYSFPSLKRLFTVVVLFQGLPTIEKSWQRFDKRLKSILTSPHQPWLSNVNE